MPRLSLDPEITRKVRALAAAIEGTGDGPLAGRIDAHVLHSGLNAFNHARLHPCLPSEDWERNLTAMRKVELVEARFVEEERAATRAQLRDLPGDRDSFIEWFVKLKETGPGQYDPFFDYLAEQADLSELKFFIKQEYCGEVGFDDLIAMTQIRFPVRAKVELARNFWDEQGEGRLEDTHGPLYSDMAHELGVRDTPDSELLWETLAVANLLTALACNRRYAWHSLGALSVIEMTSPTRASRVVRGLERVGLSPRGCRYFRLHSALDVEHWRGWLAEVIEPLLDETPELARPLAEGALLRLNAGAVVIKRYREVLGLDDRLRDFVPVGTGYA